MYPREKPVHFFHFDPRACGRRHPWRRVSALEDEVTCQDCLGNIGLDLTDRGRAVVRAIEEGRLVEYLAKEGAR